MGEHVFVSVTQKTNDFDRYTPETMIMKAAFRGIPSIPLIFFPLQVFEVKANKYYFLIMDTFQYFLIMDTFLMHSESCVLQVVNTAYLYKTHSLPLEQYSQVQVFHDFSRSTGFEQIDTQVSPAQ